MHWTRSLGLAIASLVIVPAIAHADDVVIDYPTALKLAGERAPAAVAARARIDEVRGTRAGADVRPNPELGVEAGPRFRDGDSRVDLGASLEVPIELGGRRSARVAVADAEIDAASAAAGDASRLAMRDAGLAYYRALAADERVRLATDVEAVARDIEAATGRRLAKGDALELDVNLAKAAHGRARAATRAAEADREVALGALRAALALDAADTIVLRGDLSARRTFDVEALAGDGARRPDVTELAAEQRAGAAEARLGGSFGWPEIRIGVSYGREEGADIVLGTLAFTLPMFDRGQGHRRTGHARAARAAATREALARVVDIQVRAAVAAYTKRIAAADELAAVEPLLDDSDRTLAKAYEAGQLTLADYLVARRELLDARADRVQRLLEAAEAAVEVDVAAGVAP